MNVTPQRQREVMSKPPGSGFSVKRALENYEAERHRLCGGHYPPVACQCAFCDTVRAADLLYRTVLAQEGVPVKLGKLRPNPQRRLRN